MAEEKRPLESEPQAAPEASTPDVPGAPAPDLSGDISQPVHDGPAQPDPGDVVISFEKIDELLKERRDAAREKVEQESPPEPSAEGGKEEKTKPEPEQPKPRRGRPPKEKAVSEDKDTKAATPRRGRLVSLGRSVSAGFGGLVLFRGRLLLDLLFLLLSRLVTGSGKIHHLAGM